MTVSAPGGPCPQADFAAARAPTTLWIELTSTCPFDCIFCSRKTRRGTGEHMEFALLERLIAELDHPECIRLNYSGESLHYPQLADAIGLAKSTGASTELVTSLASADEGVLRSVVASGLDRLGISLHTTSAAQWPEIYGSGSLDRQVTRLERLLALCEECGAGPALEIAFVAMQSNLRGLPAVVSLARRKGISPVTVLPVIRRDPARGAFLGELDGRGRLRDEFRKALQEAVSKARAAFPSVEIRGGPELEAGGRYAADLAPGTPIRTCDQNPWTTVHILSNGDVVPCEVHDTLVLGNLRERSLGSIWRGESYGEFRRAFVSGTNPACLSCDWKVAGSASPPARELSARDWQSTQFLRGWYPRDGAGTLWSRREALLLLPAGKRLLLKGALPPSGDGRANRLDISCNALPAGSVANPTRELLRFSTCVEVPATCGDVVVSCRVARTFRPSEAGGNGDARELGFALFGIEVLQ
jgi:radical SAM protein with 4Fe4S-binding SPASM domain